MRWRVDYAARGHGTWLSLETEFFPTPQLAIKMAQNKIERWEPCVAWRVAEDDVPTFEKITDEHLFKIVTLAGAT